MSIQSAVGAQRDRFGDARTYPRLEPADIKHTSVLMTEERKLRATSAYVATTERKSETMKRMYGI